MRRDIKLWQPPVAAALDLEQLWHPLQYKKMSFCSYLVSLGYKIFFFFFKKRPIYCLLPTQNSKISLANVGTSPSWSINRILAILSKLQQTPKPSAHLPRFSCELVSLSFCSIHQEWIERPINSSAAARVHLPPASLPLGLDSKIMRTAKVGKYSF